MILEFEMHHSHELFAKMRAGQYYAVEKMIIFDQEECTALLPKSRLTFLCHCRR